MAPVEAGVAEEEGLEPAGHPQGRGGCACIGTVPGTLAFKHGRVLF